MLREQPKDYLLIGAVVLLSLSYFYQVPSNPPGFYIDESSIAYNAYTIGVSGQDEYGENWPLFFRAFGEYKNPVYIYLLSSLFRVFGPSIFIARAFSAALGVLGIALLWLLAFRLSKHKTVASLVSMSACLTPWLFENSRLVFEVALYPALLLLFLAILYSAHQREQWKLWSIALGLVLGLLTYSYSIGRLFAPLLAFGLVFFITRNRWRSVLTTWAVFLLSLAPGLIFNWRHPGALTNRFWLLTYISPDRNWLHFFPNFCSHYLANINPWTIAVSGESNVRDHVGSMGSILAPSLLLAFAGVIYAISRLKTDQWWRFMLYALVMSPIPASLTTTQFPQIRLIALPVLLHVFMVPAVSWLIQSRQKIAQLVLAVVIVLMFGQGLVYRIQFRNAGPPRWYIFDEQFPREVLPTVLAQNQSTIYLYDPFGKSGYIQAYWHGMLNGLRAEKFVRLPSDAKPPDGAVVISTAEGCENCRMLLKSINYIVYVSGK